MRFKAFIFSAVLPVMVVGMPSGLMMTERSVEHPEGAGPARLGMSNLNSTLLHRGSLGRRLTSESPQ